MSVRAGQQLVFRQFQVREVATLAKSVGLVHRAKFAHALGERGYGFSYTALQLTTAVDNVFVVQRLRAAATGVLVRSA